MSFKHGGMQTNYKSINNLKVSEDLVSFVENELFKDSEINLEKFWLGFSEAVHNLAIKNKELIKVRENLQEKINDWHIKNKKTEIKIKEYKKFLSDIGYLKNVGPDFIIETDNVDECRRLRSQNSCN